MDSHRLEKDESASLLASIVHGKDVLSTLKSSKRNLPQLEKSLSFEVKTSDSKCETLSCCFHRCFCWYENEYFEYVDSNDSGKIDLVLFNRILDRIKQGKCEHVEEGQTKYRHPYSSDVVDLDGNKHHFKRTQKSFVSYLHAAAAVGNIKLVKYLCKEYPDYPGLRTASGLVPLHLAVLKQHVNVLKYLSDKRVYSLKGRNGHSLKKSKQLPLNYYFNWNEFECYVDSDILQPVDIYMRSKLNDHVIKVELGLYNLKTPIIALLKAIENPNIEMLLECSRYLEDRQICDLVIHLLICDKEICAIKVFKTIAKKISSLVLKVTCILTDSVRFLTTLISDGENVLMLNSDFSLIDLAEAVGSYDCLDVLCQELNKKTGVIGKRHKVAQPFFVVFYYGAISMPYLGRDFVLSFLNKIQNRGCDINRKDSSQLSPLHYALLKNKHITFDGAPVLKFEGKLTIQECIRFEFAKRMLELGANIDALDKSDRTPIFACMSDAVIGSVDSTRNVEQLIHLLLYFNSNPKCNQNLLYYSHQYEKKLYRSLVIRNTPVDESMKSDFSDLYILNITNSKSLFTVLFQLGFGIERAYALEIDPKVKQMWPVFYRCVYTQPRSLLSLCRLAIRGSNPGMKLFKMLQFHHLPVPVRKYILAEDMLSKNNFIFI